MEALKQAVILFMAGEVEPDEDPGRFVEAARECCESYGTTKEQHDFLTLLIEEVKRRFDLSRAASPGVAGPGRSGYEATLYLLQRELIWLEDDPEEETGPK